MSKKNTALSEYFIPTIIFLFSLSFFIIVCSYYYGFDNSNNKNNQETNKLVDEEIEKEDTNVNEEIKSATENKNATTTFTEVNNLEKILEDNLLEDITAKSYLAYDVKEEKVIYSKNASIKQSNASTTKLLTAIVALEEYALGDVVTVPIKCTTQALALDERQGNDIRFQAGEQFFLRDLLYAFLVGSSNDAACAVAEGIPGGMDVFVNKMNTKAKELNLKNSRVENPYGFDSEIHYFTPQDLVKLTLESRKNEYIRNAVQVRDHVFNEINTGQIYNIYNTNQLLVRVPNATGYKTGTTNGAGQCLIFGYEDKANDKDIIIVVLNSEDRFTDTITLLEESI